jgi:hypothetical protein
MNTNIIIYLGSIQLPMAQSHEEEFDRFKVQFHLKFFFKFLSDLIQGNNWLYKSRIHCSVFEDL